MSRLLLGVSLILLSAAPALAAEIGVLVLAHGGSEQWNRAVEETVEQAQLEYPTEIVFGMGMHAHEVERLQEAVDHLQQQGVDHLVAVPLLVSSSSQVARQFQYLLGLRDQGPWETGIEPVVLQIPVVMTPSLDDDPAVVEILLERALELSDAPEEEAVIIVGHGPTGRTDNAAWLDVMGRIATRLQKAGRFRAVVPVTMRDDAPTPVLEEATRHMRDVVHQQSLEGRTLVVPLLIASGGIEDKIPQRLEGLKYAYRGVPLSPHPKLAEWIVRQVEVTIKRMDERNPPVRKEMGAGRDNGVFPPRIKRESFGQTHSY